MPVRSSGTVYRVPCPLLVVGGVGACRRSRRGVPWVRQISRVASPPSPLLRPISDGRTVRKSAHCLIERVSPHRRERGASRALPTGPSGIVQTVPVRCRSQPDRTGVCQHRTKRPGRCGESRSLASRGDRLGRHHRPPGRVLSSSFESIGLAASTGDQWVVNPTYDALRPPRARRGNFAVVGLRELIGEPACALASAVPTWLRRYLP
jgi:hypothetical protein